MEIVELKVLQLHRYRKDNKYSFKNISINTTINHNRVFDCKNECENIDLIIKDGEEKITIEELFK